MSQELNYNQLDVADGVPVKMWTKGVPVEAEAQQQLANAAKLPIVFKHIAAMPAPGNRRHHWLGDPHDQGYHPRRCWCGYWLRNDGRQDHAARRGPAR